VKKRPVNLTKRAESVARIQAHRLRALRYASPKIHPVTLKPLAKFTLEDFPLDETLDSPHKPLFPKND